MTATTATPATTPTTALRMRDGLTIRTLPDGDAVVAGAGGTDAVIVNASAHAILELLASPWTEQEIADLFCETFADQDPAAVRRDVAELVQQLLHAGILEPCGTASSTA